MDYRESKNRSLYRAGAASGRPILLMDDKIPIRTMLTDGRSDRRRPEHRYAVSDAGPIFDLFTEVELHGGLIALKFSSPGKGSIFQVSLPRE